MGRILQHQIWRCSGILDKRKKLAAKEAALDEVTRQDVKTFRITSSTYGITSSALQINRPIAGVAEKLAVAKQDKNLRRQLVYRKSGHRKSNAITKRIRSSLFKGRFQCHSLKNI